MRERPKLIQTIIVLESMTPFPKVSGLEKSEKSLTIARDFEHCEGDYLAAKKKIIV